MDDEKIVLFGAGKLLPRYENLLNDLNIGFYCYTDNDKSKWGTFLHEKKVIPPSDLARFKNKIIISCNHEDDITKQLNTMGLGGRILPVRNFIKSCLSNHIREFEYLKHLKVKEKKRSIVFDLLDGNGWGGTEIWTCTVAGNLLERGHAVVILGTQDLKAQPELLERLTVRYDIQSGDNRAIIKNLVNNLAAKLPFTLINNWTGYAFAAASILKHYLPDYVNIVTMVHTDSESVFRKTAFWSENFDSIACVSRKIKKQLRDNYKIESEKLHYKESIVACGADNDKRYSTAGAPLRIGYAARLETEQKRADLFPHLIKLLEEKNIDYVLEIAGDGSCRKMINSFIAQQNLASRVIMRGYLEKEKMPGFWKSQDLFINFSEFEGTSLSMLEAMSYGVVPVVTNVSGTDDFIKTGVNGFIRPVGDIGGLAEDIAYLADNRSLIPAYGKICKEEIKSRCSIQGYMNYMESLCGFNKPAQSDRG